MNAVLTEVTFFWSELTDCDGYGPGLAGVRTLHEPGAPIELLAGMRYSHRTLAKSAAGYAWLYPPEYRELTK